MSESQDIFIRGMACYFFNCQATETKSRFHHSTLALLKSLGVEFFKTGPYPSPVDPHPEGELESDGRLIAFIIASHALLEPKNASWKSQGLFRSDYSTGIESESFQISTAPIPANIPDDYNAALQEMALGRREFLRFIIPHVKPRLAFADYVWLSGVQDRHIAAADLRRLFWVTYFGPNYVEHHGIDFFRNIPAWSVEELDGGVLVTVTETFLDFAENEPKQTLKYLKQKFKNIRPNRFKIDPAF